MALAVYLLMPYPPSSQAELIGTYVHDCTLSYEVLILLDDGTFSQAAIVKSTADVAVSHGQWKYSGGLSPNPDFGSLVFLNGFLEVVTCSEEINENYRSPHAGIVTKPIEYWFGSLVIGRADSCSVWTKTSP